MVQAISCDKLVFAEAFTHQIKIERIKNHV